MISNYFKVGSEFYTFDDKCHYSTHTAFMAACNAAKEDKISLWRMPDVMGPWDAVDLVGYRSVADIMSDIAIASPEEVSNYQDELIERKRVMRNEISGTS